VWTVAEIQTQLVNSLFTVDIPLVVAVSVVGVVVAVDIFV